MLGALGVAGEIWGIQCRFLVDFVRKYGPKWGPFGPIERLLDHFGSHLEDPGGKKSVPKVSKGNFVNIVKTSIFLRFL